MGYIEQTDIGNVYVTDINDWFATLSNLNRECKNYTDSEIRYKEILAEHDKQIRAESLHIDMEKPMHFTDEQKAWIKNYICINAERQRATVIEEVALKIQKIKDTHNENPRLYPINYGTLCGICNDLWRQLKE